MALAIPLAKVKKIVKADADAKMIKPDALTLIARSSELFVEQFVEDSYHFTKLEKRKTVKLKDMQCAINQVRRRPQFQCILTPWIGVAPHSAAGAWWGCARGGCARVCTAAVRARARVSNITVGVRVVADGDLRLPDDRREHPVQGRDRAGRQADEDRRRQRLLAAGAAQHSNSGHIAPS